MTETIFLRMPRLTNGVCYRQHVVSTFGSVEMHMSSMQREIKEFLKYYVLRPSEHSAPPPDIDCAYKHYRDGSLFTYTMTVCDWFLLTSYLCCHAVPLLLSTRSHVEMESLEKDLIDAAAASAQAGQDQEKVSDFHRSRSRARFTYPHLISVGL